MNVQEHPEAAKTPPGKARPHLAHRYLAIFGALASCSGFYFSMMEMAAILDGPGVGMFSRAPGSLGLFSMLWIIGGVVFLVGAIGMRNRRLAALIAVGGFVYCVILFASMTGQRIFAITWANRCDSGDVLFCYAAGGVHKYALGGDSGRTKGNKFYLEGCRLAGRDRAGNQRYERDLDRSWGSLSCRRLLEDKHLDKESRDAACAGLSAICEIAKKAACRRHQETCSASERPDKEQCTDLRKACTEGGDACLDLNRLGCKND